MIYLVLLNEVVVKPIFFFPFFFITCMLQLHDVSPLSVKSLKGLGDKLIADQHFTTRDFIEAVRFTSHWIQIVTFLFILVSHSCPIEVNYFCLLTGTHLCRGNTLQKLPRWLLFYFNASIF